MHSRISQPLAFRRLLYALAAFLTALTCAWLARRPIVQLAHVSIQKQDCDGSDSSSSHFAHERPNPTGPSYDRPVRRISEQASRAGLPPSSESTDHIEATATTSRVRITVLGPDGADPLDAIVIGNLEDGFAGSGYNLGWTSSTRPIPLSPGRWTFHAFSASASFDGILFHDLVSEAVEAQIERTAQTQDVLLQLAVKPGIYGVIRGCDTNTHTSVFCWRIDGRERDDRLPLWNRDIMPVLKQVTIMEHPDGQYAFEDLTPGDYLVAAGDYGRASVPVHVHLLDRGYRVDLQAPQGTQPQDLHVWVFDPFDHPCYDVSFEVFGLDGGGNRTGSSWTTTPLSQEEDGSYWLRVTGIQSNSDNPVVNRMLLVASKGLGQRLVQLPKATSNLEVRFEDPCALELNISNYELRYGTGRARGRCGPDTCNSRTTQADRDSTGLCDASGRILVNQIQPGDATVKIDWLASERGAAIELLSLELHVLPGLNQTTVTLPCFGELIVSWKDCPLGSLTVIDVSNTSHPNWSIMTQVSDGTSVRYEYLPEGEYDVTLIQSDTSTTQRVAVSGATRVRFE